MHPNSPLYNSQIDMSSLGVGLGSGGYSVYTQLFFHLKSQKTFIMQSCHSAEAYIKEQTEKDPEACQTLKEATKLINDFLNCTYGSLLSDSYQLVDRLNNLIDNTKDQTEIDYLTKFFNAVLAISRYLIKSVFHDTDEQEADPAAHIHIDESKRPELSPLAKDNVMICRICNEPVPIELIEEHTRSCIDALSNEQKIIEIDQALSTYMQKLINEDLNKVWPGKQEEATKHYLPIVHYLVLLRRVSQIENRSSDAIYELENIGSLINLLQININKTDVKKIILAKIAVCSKIEAARDVLRQTRISGSDSIASTQPIVADFTLLKRISSGAYARVYLAKKRLTGDTYAIKVLPKSNLTHKNQLKRILTERDILLQFNNPFVTKFYYSIIGKHNLYLFMEYIPGGDLFSLLEKFGCFDEESAKTYTYQTVRALQYLYENGIIHRDLKPDNILITKDGFLKLADFGLSYNGITERQTNSNSSSSNDSSLIESKSLVGTPDYISPEIVLGRSHSFTTDYWSLGVIVYEMLTGVTPFHQETEELTCSKVVKGKYEKLDDSYSPEVRDFVDRLLQVDPKNRLGAKHGPKEILEHKWLEGLKDDNLCPPWVPELKDPMSTENFEERYQQGSALKIPQDILEDITEGLSRKRSRTRLSESKRRASEGFVPYDITFLQSEDDLASFPAIHTASLGKQNEEEAQKMKRRVSDPTKKDEVPKSNFICLNSSSFGGKRKRMRKMSFSGDLGMDDSFVSTRRNTLPH